MIDTLTAQLALLVLEGKCSVIVLLRECVGEWTLVRLKNEDKQKRTVFRNGELNPT
jgi:hypothetical protein